MDAREEFMLANADEMLREAFAAHSPEWRAMLDKLGKAQRLLERLPLPVSWRKDVTLKDGALALPPDTRGRLQAFVVELVELLTTEQQVTDTDKETPNGK